MKRWPCDRKRAQVLEAHLGFKFQFCRVTLGTLSNFLKSWVFFKKNNNNVTIPTFLGSEN